jgi:hypothetical protein
MLLGSRVRAVAAIADNFKMFRRFILSLPGFREIRAVRLGMLIGGIRKPDLVLFRNALPAEGTNATVKFT